MIQNVYVKEIKKHEDQRGFFAEILKDKDPCFHEIRQVSYSETRPGVIKAFHYHKKQDDYFFVPKGKIKVVLYDLRQDSQSYCETQVIEMAEAKPMLIYIPAMVAHGYQVISKSNAGVIYLTTQSYDPEDEYRIPFDDPKIAYQWR